jgi:hypothetical protein
MGYLEVVAPKKEGKATLLVYLSFLLPHSPTAPYDRDNQRHYTCDEGQLV